jgi:hypothetical protein
VIDRVIASLAAAAVLLVCTASPSAAQIGIEIGATIGYYSPMGSFKADYPASVELPRSPSSLSGTAFGGELRLWVGPRIGLQLAGSTTASSVGGATTPDGVRPSVPARVSLGTAQLLYRVNGDESRAPVWLSAGGGAIKHGGAAYDVFHEPVNYGGVAGVGSAVRIRGGLSLDLELSSMIYNIDFRTPGITLGGLKERGTQLDMMLCTGLSYSLH